MAHDHNNRATVGSHMRLLTAGRPAATDDSLPPEPIRTPVAAPWWRVELPLALGGVFEERRLFPYATLASEVFFVFCFVQSTTTERC